MPGLKDYVSEGLRKGYSQEELTRILLQKGYSKREIDPLFGGSGKDNMSGTSKKDIGFFERLPYIIGHPNLFFENVKDQTIGKSLGLFAFAVGIMAALSMLIGMFFSTVLRTGGIFGGVGAVYGIMIGVIALVGIFIYAGLTHAFVKMFGGTGSYTDTFNALAYSAAPSTIVSWIPFVGFLAAIYAIILSIFGISEYHQLSKGKAFGALILTAIIFSIVAAVFLYIFISIAFRNW